MFESILHAQNELEATRTARLAMAKQVRELEVREAVIEEWLLRKMKLGEEYASEHNIVSRYEKLKFGIADRPKLLTYVREKDDFNCLIIRLNEKTLREYREQKIKVPGVVSEVVSQLSYRSI